MKLTPILDGSQDQPKKCVGASIYIYIYIFIYIYIYIYIHIYTYIYMIPVPGPVAPPQWYGPLLPDLESFISMVFTAFWMQNLTCPQYLHQFGWRTSYFHGKYSILDAKPTYVGTKEYSYITSLYIYTYLYMYILYISIYI